MPGPHCGVVGEPVEQPPKAGPLNARVVIVRSTAHFPHEQQIAGDQDPPRRFVDHQVVWAVARHVEELEPQAADFKLLLVPKAKIRAATRGT